MGTTLSQAALSWTVRRRDLSFPVGTDLYVQGKNRRCGKCALCGSRRHNVAGRRPFLHRCVEPVFYPLDTKNHRINYLMLPASNAEKLLVRALVYPLCAAVLCAVALLLADGLRMLLFASAARHYGPVFPYVVGLMAEGAGEILDIAMSPREGGIHGVWIASLIVSYFTFNFSCYLLGSAFFRRHTFLKTSVSLIAFMVAIGFLMDLILWLSGMQSERVSASDALMIYLTDTLVPLFVVLFTLLTVFNVWAGCRHFTRIQIISRKLLQLKK